MDGADDFSGRYHRPGFFHDGAAYLQEREETGSRFSLELNLFDCSGDGFAVPAADAVGECVHSLPDSFPSENDVGMFGSDSLDLRLGLGWGLTPQRLSLRRWEAAAVAGAGDYVCPPVEDPPCEEFCWEVVDERMDELFIHDEGVRSDVSTGLDPMLLDAGDAEDAGFEVEGNIPIGWEDFMVGGNNDEVEGEVEEEEDPPRLGALGISPDWEYFDIDDESFSEAVDVMLQDHEPWLGQAADENITKGSPPTANSVIDTLPTIMVSQLDVEKNNNVCAVCKDEMVLGDKAKRLPCSHHYHKECIVPWLMIRSTCPVCRFELRTDDVDYENWKARRTARGSHSRSYGEVDLNL